jgi:hypothetical protein
VPLLMASLGTGVGKQVSGNMLSSTALILILRLRIRSSPHGPHLEKPIPMCRVQTSSNSTLRSPNATDLVAPPLNMPQANQVAIPYTSPTPPNGACNLINQLGITILPAGTVGTEEVRLTNKYIISILAMLQGPRCYIDASTPPDHLSPQPRPAGLGIFILNFQAQPPQYIYIKAKLSACSSVLMALHNISRSQDSRIFKISRTQNTTVDALARQALSSQLTHLQISCTNRACVHHCSVLQALHLVDLSDVTLLTVFCC